VQDAESELPGHWRALRFSFVVVENKKPGFAPHGEDSRQCGLAPDRVGSQHMPPWSQLKGEPPVVVLGTDIEVLVDDGLAVYVDCDIDPP
jgi:hypothetical protein